MVGLHYQACSHQPIGKITRIDTKTIRATMGVKLLDLDDADKVAADVTIPNEEKSEEDMPVIQ